MTEAANAAAMNIGRLCGSSLKDPQARAALLVRNVDYPGPVPSSLPIGVKAVSPHKLLMESGTTKTSARRWLESRVKVAVLAERVDDCRIKRPWPTMPFVAVEMKDVMARARRAHLAAGTAPRSLAMDPARQVSDLDPSKFR